MAITAYKKKKQSQPAPTPTARGLPVTEVKSGGRTYPTTNPNFKPSEEAQKIENTIEFRPGGNVVYGGKNLSAEEYKGVLGKGGGVVTPAVEEIRQKIIADEETKQITADAERQARVETLKEQRKRELNLQGMEDNPLPIVEEALTQQQEAQALKDQTQQPTAGGIIGRFVAPLPTMLTGKENPALPEIISSAAQIYDAIEKAIGNRKSARVQMAEGSFAEATNALRTDIDAVRAGIKPPEEAKRNFEEAVAAIDRLQRTTHGLGLVNLRRWLDNGKELEASIINEKAILEDLRLKLAMASVGI